jgi:hypothetical protein
LPWLRYTCMCGDQIPYERLRKAIDINVISIEHRYLKTRTINMCCPWPETHAIATKLTLILGINVLEIIISV